MTTTTQTIDKQIDEHKQLLKDFKNNPMFEAFEMWVDYKLLNRDQEIAKCYKHIKLCQEEINSLRLIMKLEKTVL